MLLGGRAGAELELALDHAEHVDRDPRVERDAALGRGHHVALEVLAHRGDELGRGRSVLVVTSRPCDQLQQVPLRLGDPAAERGELHRADEAVQVAEACISQITPHFSVPNVSQKRRCSGSTVAAARLGVRGEQLVERAEAADELVERCRSATTSRTASRGPRPGRRGARAPSRAPTRMPSGPTMKLPLRKSPCTRRGGASGRCARRAPRASAARARTRDAARRARRGRRGTARSARAGPAPASFGSARRRRPRGSAPRSRRTASASCGRASAYSSSRRIRRGIVSPVDAVHHEAVAELVVRLEQELHRRHGHARGGRRLQQPVLGRAVRRPDARPRVAAQHELDRRPSSTSASNDQVSRDAPPDSRRSASIVTAPPRCRAHVAAARSSLQRSSGVPRIRTACNRRAARR